MAKEKGGNLCTEPVMTVEQTQGALQPGWGNKPSSVRQQQLEEKENRQNRMESVSQSF